MKRLGNPPTSPEEIKETSPTARAPPKKNTAAVALGRIGGLKGGKARPTALSKKKRAEIARKPLPWVGEDRVEGQLPPAARILNSGATPKAVRRTPLQSVGDWRRASLQDRARRLTRGRNAAAWWALFWFGGEDTEEIDPDDNWETEKIFQHAATAEYQELAGEYGAQTREAARKVHRGLGWTPSDLYEFYRRADEADLPGKASGLSGQRRRDERALRVARRRLEIQAPKAVREQRQSLDREQEAFDIKYGTIPQVTTGDDGRRRPPGRPDTQLTILRRRLRNGAGLTLREIAIVELAYVDAKRLSPARELGNPTLAGAGEPGETDYEVSMADKIADLSDRIAKAIRPTEKKRKRIRKKQQ